MFTEKSNLKPLVNMVEIPMCVLRLYLVSIFLSIFKLFLLFFVQFCFYFIDKNEFISAVDKFKRSSVDCPPFYDTHLH